MAQDNTKGEPQLPQIKLSDTTAIQCECGSEVFVNGVSLRGVSMLQSGTGKPEILLNGLGIVCAKCQKKFEAPKAPEPSLIQPA